MNLQIIWYIFLILVISFVFLLIITIPVKESAIVKSLYWTAKRNILTGFELDEILKILELIYDNPESAVYDLTGNPKLLNNLYIELARTATPIDAQIIIICLINSFLPDYE